MRFTLGPGGVTPDISRKNDGRGFYLCRDQKCIDRAFKRRAFNRVCRTQIDMEKLKEAVQTALDATKEGMNVKKS
jgi:hypothetical protein